VLLPILTFRLSLVEMEIKESVNIEFQSDIGKHILRCATT